LVKRGDKQFRRSLKTKDRKLADRRLAEYRAQVDNLTTSDDARLSFDAIARRWISVLPWRRHSQRATATLRTMADGAGSETMPPLTSNLKAAAPRKPGSLGVGS
jgi:hypothetical protein